RAQERHERQYTGHDPPGDDAGEELVPPVECHPTVKPLEPAVVRGERREEESEEEEGEYCVGEAPVEPLRQDVPDDEQPDEREVKLELVAERPEYGDQVPVAEDV